MGISWWESMCVFELVLNEVSHTRTHLDRTLASPRSMQSLEKMELISCHSPQRDRQQDRWTEKKNNPREKVDDNNPNYRVAEKQRIPLEA